MHSASASSPVATSVATVSKMPNGAEARLRDLWSQAHRFPLPGAWLVNEDTMAKIYVGLTSESKALYVPDIVSIGRKSDLNQKAKRGTLITDEGMQSVDFTLTPCSTHPDFWVRIRAFIMTICFVAISLKDFFSLETALETVEFIFEAINSRADGKRPTLDCLVKCYLSMFGAYAKALQNQKTPLEKWLANTGNWQHLWFESIVSFEHAGAARAAEPASAIPGVPSDLSKMVESNAMTMHNMKSQLGQVMSAWNMQGGKAGNRRGGNRFGRRGGNGGTGGKGQSKGGEQAADGTTQQPGGKRQVTAGGAAFAKRARRSGGKGQSR